MQLLNSLSPLGITFLSLIGITSIIGLSTALLKFYQLYLSTVTSREAQQPTINPQAANSDCDSDQLIQFLHQQDSRDAATLTSLAETESRSFILRWEAGLNILEIVITIAPLLGLLGTASGLFEIFLGIGESQSESAYQDLASGISTALVTTIAGLAIAVPMVILHSSFVRKIELLKSDFERIGTRFIQQISA